MLDIDLTHDLFHLYTLHCRQIFNFRGSLMDTLVPLSNEGGRHELNETYDDAGKLLHKQ